MSIDDIHLLSLPVLENIYLAMLDKNLKYNEVRKAGLCRIAAIGGYSVAISEYANMLFAGRGVVQNKREALNYYL